MQTLYADLRLFIKEICRQAGVCKYLYKHAPELVQEITNRQKQKSDYSLTTSGEYRVTYAH